MDKKSTDLLIIFYRNPDAGKVKTRLAATLGIDKALDIYRKLARHTRDVAKQTAFDKVVYYSDFIDRKDMWPNETFGKAAQLGDDLGERMKNAFTESFEKGYASVCIVGTDCFELTEQVINEAFAALRSADAVIGPARDGGYYLLGMNRLLPAVFENKHWSTESVFRETIRDLESLDLACTTLSELGDVDTEEDLPDELR